MEENDNKQEAGISQDEAWGILIDAFDRATKAVNIICEDDQVVADSYKKFLMMWVDSFSAIYEMRSRDRERIRELEHKLGLFLNKKD